MEGQLMQQGCISLPAGSYPCLRQDRLEEQEYKLKQMEPGDQLVSLWEYSPQWNCLSGQRGGGND